jgi:predicted GH43/DUF377 family glycosyl hydrolase
MASLSPKLTSSPLVKRYNGGEPVLSAKDIPYPADCVFNAGVTKFQGKYVMVFRDDRNYNEKTQMFRERIMGVAESSDGIKWEVRNKPFLTKDMIPLPDIVHVYDPRITILDGVPYLCFAVDTSHVFTVPSEQPAAAVSRWLNPAARNRRMSFTLPMASLLIFMFPSRLLLGTLWNVEGSLFKCAGLMFKCFRGSR